MLSTIVFIVTIIITIFLLVMLSYNLISIYYEKQTDIKELLNEKTSKVEAKKIRQHFKAVQKEEGKAITFIKSLLLKANVKSRFLNVYSILMLSALSGGLFFIISNSIFTILQSMIIGVFGALLPTTILYMLAEWIGDKTNFYFIDLLNLLQNYLEIKDDINFAMSSVINPRYKLGNLKQFIEDYVFDIGHGYSTEDSLVRFSNKIDNQQIKDLCNTLINCSKTSGKYLLVVSRYSSNYVELYDKLIERRTGAKKKRGEMFGVFGVGILLLIATSISNKNLYETLQASKIGQGLVALTLISLIAVFFLAISVGRFEFD